MSKTVLLIEDDERNMKLFRDVLGVKGYATLEARDGRTGIDMAKEHRPDAIVLDIQLPVLDGFKVARALKSDPVTERIPIIAVTSHAMVGDKQKTVVAGCDAYMSKPIHVPDFVAAIEKLVNAQPAPLDRRTTGKTR